MIKKEKIMVKSLNSFFLIVLLVIACAVGSYFVFANIINKNEIVDKTANWQTYRNEDYGFELKYPNNWLFGEDKISYNATTTGQGFSFYYSWGNDYCQVDISLLPKGFDIDNEIDNLKNLGCEESIVNINGITGKKMHTSFPGTIADSDIIFLTKQDMSFRLGWIYHIARYEEPTSDSGEKECLQIFNQILHTFRFLNNI